MICTGYYFHSMSFLRLIRIIDLFWDSFKLEFGFNCLTFFSCLHNPNKIYALHEVQLIAPITKPDKIIGVSSNYKSDCDKSNTAYLKEPVVFSKFSSALTGPYEDIQKPQATCVSNSR